MGYGPGHELAVLMLADVKAFTRRRLFAGKAVVAQRTDQAVVGLDRGFGIAATGETGAFPEGSKGVFS